MRPNIAALFLVSVIFIFLQSKIELPPSQQHVGTGETVESVEISGVISSSASFNEIFSRNVTTSKAAPGSSIGNNKPPPREKWLLNLKEVIDAQSIPRIINKIYFQKESGYPSSDSMSASLTAAHQSWSEMNPGYTIRYFDLEQARHYLHEHYHPVFIRAFDCLPAFAAKSDLFRMALLYRDGGWHSDWKQVCLEKHILQNITETTDFYANYDLWESNDYFKHKCVQNAFVGSRPQHPIIAKMLEMLLLNIQTSHYGPSALDATATCIFGRAIHVSEDERKSQIFSQIAGHFVDDKIHGAAYQWNLRTVVKHKCNNCGEGQSWGNSGNNYIALYKQRNFYCQDAASLFKIIV